MSVFCSFGVFDADHTCGDDFGHPQPYAYQRSHILPKASDPRAGNLDFGAIPGFITRDGRDEGVEGEWWPWLRVSLQGSDEEPDTIVLDVAQVDALIVELTEWRARVNEALR